MGEPTLTQAFRDDEYRAFLVLLVLSGVATSSCLPLISLFFVSVMDVSLATAGLITVAALCGPFLVMFAGHLSDRVESRMLVARLAAAWLCVGSVAFSLTQSTWQAVVVYALFLSALGAVNAQIFACLHDALTDRGEPRPATITSTLRGGFAFGFVFGPLIGTSIAEASTLRAAFVATAVLYAIVGLMTLTIGRRRALEVTERPQGTTHAHTLVPVVLFSAGVTLVLTGDYLRNTYLPLHVVDGLHSSMTAFGTLIAVSAAVEVAVFPALGMLADRFGMRQVIAAALAIGVVDYAILAASQGLWQVYVSQLLHVVVLAAVYGLGITYAQSLAASRAGAATSAFFSAQSISNPASGVLGAATVGALGLSGIFWIPGALCLGCLVGFALSWRRRPIGRAQMAAAESPAT